MSSDSPVDGFTRSAAVSRNRWRKCAQGLLSPAIPVLVLLLLGADQALAQPAPESEQAGFANSTKGAGNVAYPVSLMSLKEFGLSVIITLFGIVTLYSVHRLFSRSASDRIEEATRMHTVILIVIGTLLLISAGFDAQKIAPALGLFGTIAGYLLGRAERRSPRDDSK